MLGDGQLEAPEAIARSLITQMAAGTQHSQGVAGGLLRRLLRDFPGLRWSSAALAALYMGASENGADSQDGSQVYPLLQQVSSGPS